MGQPDYEAPETPEETTCDELVSPIGRTHAEAMAERAKNPAYREALDDLVRPEVVAKIDAAVDRHFIGGGTDTGSGA